MNFLEVDSINGCVGERFYLLNKSYGCALIISRICDVAEKSHLMMLKEEAGQSNENIA